ncbi:unnamed protein product [Symbiodinium sp. CCMP2592]|nr:unnamed protein product [Symbiodinium sp. CCMP2592]
MTRPSVPAALNRLCNCVLVHVSCSYAWSSRFVDCGQATVGSVDERVESLEAIVKVIQETLKAHNARSLKSVDVDSEDTARVLGPKWGQEASGPSPLRPPEDDDVSEILEGVLVGEGADNNNMNKENTSPLKPRTGRGQRKTISTAKVTQINERTLDTQTQEYYSFGESTWDLFMFIGTGALGPLGSLQTFVLAIVNVVMQGIFVGIALFNFTDPDITPQTIEDTLRWRRSSGHSLSQYDDVSKSSLVARVCQLDKSLPVSGIQMSMYENIRKYIKPEAVGVERFFTGQVLCLVALICWYLMVAKEVSHALALHRGIASVNRGPTTLLTRENPFTQVTHYRLTAVSRRRKVISALLLAYRMVAAGLLIYVGTFFLVYTVNVTELILNAVALGIILDIDDLLFDALATTPGRHLVHQLDSLPMPSFPRFRGADAKSMSMSFLIPGLTILIYFTMLAPIVQTLTDVSTAMCGGAHEFVWTLDKRRVVLMSPTTGGGWDNLSGSIQYLAVDEAEGLPTVDGIPNLEAIQETEYGFWVREVSRLTDASVLSLDETVDAYNPDCGDIGNQEPILNYLRNAVGNQSLRGCADAKPYCDSITKMPGWTNDGGAGFTVRMFCSETCGCTDPGGESLHIEGCPYGKGRPCWKTAAFEDAVVTAVCKEKSAEELRNFTPWISWVNTIEAFSQEEGSLMGKPEAARLAQAMWEHGCGFAANLSAENISWGTCDQWNTTFDWHWKTVSYYCPTSCSCGWDSPAESTCPLPLGRTCDDLEDCLFANNQYYCPENAPTIKGSLVLDISNPVLMIPHVDSVGIAIQELVAQLAGNGVEPWMVYPSEVGGIPGLGRRLAMVQLEFQIYQIGGNMDENDIKKNLQDGESSQMTSIFITALDGMGVETGAWGPSINITASTGHALVAALELVLALEVAVEVALEVAKMVEMVRVETALVEMAMTVLATMQVILATAVEAAAAQAAAAVAQAEVVLAGMEMMVQVTTLAVAVGLAVAAAPAEMEMMVLVMILVVAVAPAAVAPVGMEVMVLAATLAVAAAQVGMEVMVLVTTLAVAAAQVGMEVMVLVTTLAVAVAPVAAAVAPAVVLALVLAVVLVATLAVAAAPVAAAPVLVLVLVVARVEDSQAQRHETTSLHLGLVTRSASFIAADSLVV